MLSRSKFNRKDWKEHRKQLRHGHEVWRPKKRLTRYEMDHLRTLKQQDPEIWTVSKLSQSFGISVSSVVRILKSKFEPLPEVQERQDARALQQREERRGKHRSQGDSQKEK